MVRHEELRENLRELMNGRLTATFITLDLNGVERGPEGLLAANPLSATELTEEELELPFTPFRAASLEVSSNRHDVVLDDEELDWLLDGLVPRSAGMDESPEAPKETPTSQDEEPKAKHTEAETRHEVPKAQGQVSTGPSEAPKATKRPRDGEIGLGSQECIARVLHTTDPDGEVRFGRSIGTLLEAFYQREDRAAAMESDELVDEIFMDGIEFFEGQPQQCLSLWRTELPGIAVLVVEDLKRSTRTIPSTVDHRVERLTRFLESLSKDGGTTLETLGFGGLEASILKEPLADLVVESMDTVRGEPLARAVTVIMESDMQGAIDQFLAMDNEADFDAIEEQQDTGYVPQPLRLELVSEPATAENCSAASADGRLVLINLDSMSVHHDYLGASSEHLLVAVMPVLADIAETEVRLRRLRKSFEASDHIAKLDEQLELITEVRIGHVRRSHVRLAAGREQAKRWSNSGHLASFLYLCLDEARAEIDALTERSVKTVESISAIQQQKKDGQNAQLGIGLTIVATLFAFLGVWAALLSVPSWEQARMATLVVMVPVLALAAVLLWTKIPNPRRRR